MIEQPFSIYHLEYYILITTRVLGAMIYAPIFGNRPVSMRVRVFMSIGIGLSVAFAMPYAPLPYTNFWGYTMLLIKELVTGLIMGFMSSLVLSIINMAGQFIDRDIGFAMASSFDPTTGMQTTISSNLYSYTVMIIMLCTNMCYFIISAVTESFQVIPIGGAVFNMDALFTSFLNFIVAYFIIALRISLPVFVVIMILNTTLGILAKTAPQINMFVVGLQLKILLGLVVLMATIGFLPTVTEYVYNEMVAVVADVIKGMY